MCGRRCRELSDELFPRLAVPPPLFVAAVGGGGAAKREAEDRKEHKMGRCNGRSNEQRQDSTPTQGAAPAGNTLPVVEGGCEA
uniref:Uncharacterized protein n=1 Tax=Vespula pensylvanica TaxID=30213 RepID=A0A834NWX1_VESPE|nr:hypothetical protein H0235_010373 [Vespula pensylvanica]